MHALEAGQTIVISCPRNHFALFERAPHSLLLAGGIGITPLLCMAQRLSAIGQSFELHYCARSPERAAFADRIAGATAGSAHVHYDSGSADQLMDVRAALATQPADTHLYVCGPAGFMDAMLAAARDAAWPEERLHREYFGAAPVDAGLDDSFEVQIASTGAVVRVGPESTVVQALAAVGIELPTSCEQGVCGTCVTRLISGAPDHRDMYLTPQEQQRGDQFIPCCSRSMSARLVLDL